MSESRFRVFKFGGSSVGTPERLHRVLQRILLEHDRGQIAVVVSAMGDTTDLLLEALTLAADGELEGAERLVDQVQDLATSNAHAVLAQLNADHQVEKRPELTHLVREMLAPLRQLLLGVSLLRQRTFQATDLVLSFGERVSATVIAELLQAVGQPGHFVDARGWMITDDTFGNAVVDWQVTAENLESLAPHWRGKIPVNTGFLGQTPDGRTTTLGRNGSDYTATLLGRGLSALEVVICTDVPGVMTADPAIVEDAYPVPRLSYMEALELANYGARMFHPRTMLPLIESGIPMAIRHTMSPGTGTEGSDAPDAGAPDGTLINAAGAEGEGPTCVTSLENQALINLQWRQLSQPARIGRRVLEGIDRAGITVWMANQAAHGQAVALVVPVAQLEDARAAIQEALALEVELNLVAVEDVQPVTLLSLVAERVAAREQVAGRFFDALGAVGINLLAIAQGGSTRSISCVIGAEDTSNAVRTVHDAFNFSHQEVSVAVLGKGVVGAELLSQIKRQHHVLEQDHDISLRLVALADSQHIAFNATGLDLDAVPSLLDADDVSDNSPEKMTALLERLRRLPVPVLVDCTAASGHQTLFQQALKRGIHVVSANKKPFTVPMVEYRGLLDSARSASRALHYETTVGASLPVIDTLKNILRTGDRVFRIEGALSGTLGYLTNEAMTGVPLSEAVRKAVELGYSEPQPQDDLSGTDVARKGLILARELGLELDIEDVSVEPLVPPDLIEIQDVDRFLSALAEYDDEFGARIERMKKENKTLRYLAIIDPALDSDRDPAVKVGPVEVPADHPATRLRGSESFVAFTTARFQQYPMIVQGAGAGGAVTASGVLADTLRIAQTLRGRA